MGPPYRKTASHRCSHPQRVPNKTFPVRTVLFFGGFTLPPPFIFISNINCNFSKTLPLRLIQQFVRGYVGWECFAQYFCLGYHESSQDPGHEDVDVYLETLSVSCLFLRGRNRSKLWINIVHCVRPVSPPARSDVLGSARAESSLLMLLSCCC